MKKQFIFILASIFTMLFAACSQENELDAPGGEKSNLVSVSTQLPADFAKTRALPGAADHQLRCILEVWSTGENVKLIHRLEKIGTAGADNIIFDFSLDTEGDYDCLMWADFIAADAAATSGKYADKYYTTTDLKAIEVINSKDLFNNDACDAFFAKAVLKKTTAAGTLAASLTRPFAKLTLMENEKNAATFTTCTDVSVSYDAPSKFNVMDGNVSASKVVTYNAAPKEPKENRVYFTSYILADANGSLGEISLAFTAGEGTSPITKKIPAGVPAKQNYRTNATGFLMGAKPANSQDASVKVEIDGAWTGDETVDNAGEVREPAVGDFYYSDGSYSADLNSGKTCVGIVFAVGAQQGDAIGNYTGTGLTGEIKGYVLAAKEVMSTGTTKFYKDSKLELTGFENINETDFLGYTYTNILKTAYQAEVANSDEKTAKELFPFFTPLSGTRSGVAPEATSGWYLPSTGQLNLISQLYYTPATSSDGIIKTKLSALGEAGEMFANDPSNYKLNIYLSSTLTPEGAVYRTSFELKDGVYKTEKASTTNAGGRLRCILTF